MREKKSSTTKSPPNCGAARLTGETQVKCPFDEVLKLSTKILPDQQQNCLRRNKVLLSTAEFIRPGLALV